MFSHFRHSITLTTSIVTPLAGRLFGVWTLLACVVRLTCATHVHESGIYLVTLFSFVIVFAFYINEVIRERTASFATAIFPLCVAGQFFALFFDLLDSKNDKNKLIKITIIFVREPKFP